MKSVVKDLDLKQPFLTINQEEEKECLSKSKGGWKRAALHLGSLSLCNIAYGAIMSSLVVYLMEQWGESSATAANSVTNLIGFAFMCPFLGAILAEGLWTRTKAILVFQTTLFVGCAMLAVATEVHARGDMEDTSIFLFVSLYVMAMGIGASQAILIPQGADQLDTPQDKARFFTMCVICKNLGQLLGPTIFAYLQTILHLWVLGTSIAAVAAFFSLLLFILSLFHSCQLATDTRNKPLIRITQVLVARARKLYSGFTDARSSLFEVVQSEEIRPVPTVKNLFHTKSLRQLDNVEATSNMVESPPPWATNASDAEGVQSLGRLLPFFIIGISFEAIKTQMTTLFTEQGQLMERTLILKSQKSFSLPSSSMQLFETLSSIMCGFIWDLVMLPMARRWRGHPKGLSSLHRFGIGFFLSTVAMVVAALIEGMRLESRGEPSMTSSLSILSGGDPTTSTSTSLSILWLAPQYIILGLAHSLVAAGGMEFFYNEVPEGMRCLGTSLCMSTAAMGNYTSTLLVLITSQCGWIAGDLNQGHLNYFYWFLALIMALDSLLFIACAYRHTSLNLVGTSFGSEDTCGLDNIDIEENRLLMSSPVARPTMKC